MSMRYYAKVESGEWTVGWDSETPVDRAFFADENTFLVS